MCTNRLIKEELDWYETEGLHAPQIGFLDNQPVLGIFTYQFLLESIVCE